ncbi:unnamed protein product [Caenorhabditis brenneri]
MSDRYKYAKNGIYKCENFEQQVWRNYNFDRIGLDTIGGIFIGWYLKCDLKRKNGRVFLSPVLSCEILPKVRLRTFLNILKKDGSSGSLRRENNWTWYLKGYKSLGKPFDVSELLNPENEYLDGDGAISIEYGIQFDARWEECWMFNFHDTVFNYTGEENQMIRCSHTINRDRPSTFYCSAEILNFHCPQFVEQAEKIDTKDGDFRDFFRCLQILHGVRIQLNCRNYLHFLETAQTFNLSNVIHYCDRPYIKGKDGFSGTKTPNARNGIYKCENFAQHLERNSFPEYELRSIGGISGWYFWCWPITKDGRMCLQILHGVRLQPEHYNLFAILEIAQSLNLSNVIRYCDQHYMEEIYLCDWIRFNRLVRFNLRHILTKNLMILDWKTVVETAKKLNFEEATGEAMKTFRQMEAFGDGISSARLESETTK